MYTQKAFKTNNQSIINQLIEDNPFATLVSTQNDSIEVTHLPINKFKDGKLYGHVSISNPHSMVDETKEVCLIFTGEHAYISPRYYQTSFNVPTWNYSAVHVYGYIKYIHQEDKVWALLKELTTIYEASNGWKLPNKEEFKDLVKFLRFFEVEVVSVKEKFKFNQNKSQEDIESVIQSLNQNNQQDVASFMELINKKTK